MSTATHTVRGRRQPSPRKVSHWNKRAILITVVVVVALGAVVAAMMLSSRSQQSSATKVAAAFTVTDTAGQTISLADFKGKSVLLYFNEGVGCDACFYQQVDIEKHAAQLKALGVTVLPVVMNPANEVRPELTRFNLTTPYLIDADGSVSDSYGMLGKGMHAGLPGHGFVLIDGDGVVRWQGEYPTMYLSAPELITNIKKSLPQ